jgi:predicted sulfurtransferase
MANDLAMKVIGKVRSIFDDRMAMDFSDKAKVIGECDNAAHPQSHLEMDPWTRSFWRGTYYVTT